MRQKKTDEAISCSSLKQCLRQNLIIYTKAQTQKQTYIFELFANAVNGNTRAIECKKTLQQSEEPALDPKPQGFVKLKAMDININTV